METNHSADTAANLLSVPPDTADSVSTAGPDGDATILVFPSSDTSAVSGTAGNPAGASPTLPAPRASVRPDPVASYLAGLSRGSRPATRSVLGEIARLFGHGDPADIDWTGVTYAETSAVRAVLRDRFAPATANRAISALRCTLREAWRLGLMGHEQYLRASDLAAVRGSGTQAGRLVEGGEVAAILEACGADPSPTRGARDAAIIGLCAGGGLRRAEAAGLTLADYDASSRAVTVHGKGGRVRSVYLPDWAGELVDGWVSLRGRWAGPLLCALYTGGHVHRIAIGGDAIRTRLQARAAEAGVEALNPHDLRRSVLTSLFSAGTDGALVQRIAGHVSPSTTIRYDRRPADAARAATRALPLPRRVPE